MEIKIKLKIKDVEIELAEEEIKDLLKMLSKIFGEKIVREKEYIPYYPYHRWWEWQPWVATRWTTTTTEDSWTWDNKTNTLSLKDN